MVRNFPPLENTKFHRGYQNTAVKYCWMLRGIFLQKYFVLVEQMNGYPIILTTWGHATSVYYNTLAYIWRAMGDVVENSCSSVSKTELHNILWWFSKGWTDIFGTRTRQQKTEKIGTELPFYSSMEAKDKCFVNSKIGRYCRYSHIYRTESLTVSHQHC